MTPTRAQLAFVVIFIVFVVIQAVLVAVPWLQGEIYADQMRGLLIKLLSIYSIPFAVIAGDFFGRGKSPKRLVRKDVFFVPLVLFLVWNVLLGWRIGVFAFSRLDSVHDVLKYLDTMTAASSFLVVGALTYIFAKRG